MNEIDIIAEINSLKSRISYYDDERGIRNLLVRHDYFFDCMKDQEWLDLWTQDGAIDIISTVNYPDGSRRELAEVYDGMEGLTRFATHPDGHHRPGFYGHSLHCASNNMTVTVNGDEAHATTYSLLFQETDGVVQLVSGANNYWRFRRTEHGWRICLRRRRQMGAPSFSTNVDEAA